MASLPRVQMPSPGLRLAIACLTMAFIAPVAPVCAQPAPFDLAGPVLDVQVTHAGVTLPIAETPNLAAGDQVAIRADLPASESIHYLLVAAFLRGSTNPPPKDWFFRAETWTKRGRDGLKMIVPEGAQQVIVFLAPTTGGDFGTLMNAVQGRPGAFVRASQDLNQATLDRSRLDTFLTALHHDDQADPAKLKDATDLLARSLSLKLDPKCFEKMPELQAACLSQGGDTLVLNDGHSTSIVEALTSGNAFDLVQQLSATPQAGFGFYSPYVAAAADIARILDSFRTAQFQYIPALASLHGSKMTLVLNSPPSFHNPLSVLVTALPAVEPPQTPPLRPVDAAAVSCAARPDLVLPVEGAPLVFSTGYAHDMVLRLKGKDGPIDLPVTADAEKGGLVVDAAHFDPSLFGDAMEATLHGEWGFASFDGPTFRLQNVRPGSWRLAEGDQQSLIVGRDDVVHLQGDAASCVESVVVQPADGGAPQTVEWKAAGPDQLAITAPLKSAEPGKLTFLVKQYGGKTAEPVPLQAFAQPGHLDSFTFHAGDASGVLKGTRLDEVSGLTLAGTAFTPGQLDTAGGADSLALAAADPTPDAALSRLRPGQTVTVKVALKDGRTVSLKAPVLAPRPKVVLIGKSVQPAAGAAPSAIRLTGDGELPQGSLMTFSLRAQAPAEFRGREAVDVATVDGSANVTLTMNAGLTQADAHVILATLDTAKAFSGSAYGPLRFRIVEDGVAGDWQPLATLVRLPVLTGLKCPGGMDHGCELTGANLFLLDSVSADPGFDKAAKAPEGFTGSALPVPHPVGGKLYLKLHDDPTSIDQVDLPLGEGDGRKH